MELANKFWRKIDSQPEKQESVYEKQEAEEDNASIIPDDSLPNHGEEE